MFALSPMLFPVHGRHAAVLKEPRAPTLDGEDKDRHPGQISPRICGATVYLNKC